MSQPSITDVKPAHFPKLDAAWQRVRLLVRVDELWLAGFAALVGVVAGAGVAAMNGVTHTLHRLLFNLPAGQGLSDAPLSLIHI